MAAGQQLSKGGWTGEWNFACIVGGGVGDINVMDEKKRDKKEMK